ncbi:SGNH/GDSL hydrolase family protein [Clavibacter zhangzhiyongii]|uniref:SGNH/GDSL hydrolase family protein n=1 Tax=Clavibacter zhangzhiyongii TaxID=2768071 RepID=UPI002E2D1FF4|nr:SGNH/GDSL hydrolase family protein [Clavibacter zhangzhiyongii]
MPTRTTRSARPAAVIASLAAVLGGLTAAALVVPRRFEAGRRERAVILNETLPVNSAWWRDHAKTEGDLLYVALGDSTAQGIGASRPVNGYVGILADRIRALSGRTVRTVNLSVSGARVADLIDYQLPRLAKLQPDVVTLAIGANDIPAFEPVAFERDLGRILDAVPPTTVVADLPCFHFPTSERKVRVANEIVRRLAADRGLRVAPLHRTTRRQTAILALTQAAGDLFHPNDRGYRVWASAFLPFLPAVVRALEVAGR